MIIASRDVYAGNQGKRQVGVGSKTASKNGSVMKAINVEITPHCNLTFYSIASIGYAAGETRG